MRSGIAGPREDRTAGADRLGQPVERLAPGRPPDTAVRVSDVLTQYLAVAEIDQSTKDTHGGFIGRTIAPAIGSMELRKIRGPILDMFYARLRRCGDPSSSTITSRYW